MLTLPAKDQPLEKLQQKLNERFKVTAHFETNELDVLIVKRSNLDAAGLIPTIGGESSVGGNLRTNLKISNWRLKNFADQFEEILDVPVFDETGVTNNYDCNVTWQQHPGETSKDAFKRAVSEQLGLDFEPSRREIKKLVVERVK